MSLTPKDKLFVDQGLVAWPLSVKPVFCAVRRLVWCYVLGSCFCSYLEFSLFYLAKKNNLMCPQLPNSFSPLNAVLFCPV